MGLRQALQAFLQSTSAGFDVEDIDQALKLFDIRRFEIRVVHHEGKTWLIRTEILDGEGLFVTSETHIKRGA